MNSIDQAMFTSVAHEVHATLKPKFSGEVGAVAFHRANADVELLSNLPVGISLHDVGLDFGLAWSEGFNVLIF